MPVIDLGWVDSAFEASHRQRGLNVANLDSDGNYILSDAGVEKCEPPLTKTPRGWSRKKRLKKNNLGRLLASGKAN